MQIMSLYIHILQGFQRSQPTLSMHMGILHTNKSALLYKVTTVWWFLQTSGMLEAISAQKSQVGILVRWPPLDSVGLGMTSLGRFPDFMPENAPPRSHQNGDGLCLMLLDIFGLTCLYPLGPLELKERLESPCVSLWPSIDNLGPLASTSTWPIHINARSVPI